MKYIKQLTLILSVSFVGELLSAIVPYPVPAGIYGIVILFLLLCLKIIPLSAVRDTADFLIEIMPLMFIPAAVGLISSAETVKNSWIEFVSISLVSTVVFMAVSGRITQGIIRSKRRRHKR